MILQRMLLIGGFVFGLGAIIRWLAAYGSESRNANARPEWRLGWSPFGRSPDTTVSAYARHVYEDAQTFDAEAARAMEYPATATVIKTPEVVTEARTEQRVP